MSVWIGSALLVIGAALLVLPAWGVLMLPDALSRQHASTKAVTFALSVICIGAICTLGEIGWTFRLLLIVGSLLATLPIGAHLLARIYWRVRLCGRRILMNKFVRRQW